MSSSRQSFIKIEESDYDRVRYDLNLIYGRLTKYRRGGEFLVQPVNRPHRPDIDAVLEWLTYEGVSASIVILDLQEVSKVVDYYQ